MRKFPQIMIILVWALTLPLLAQAHTLYMNVNDNEDGTVTVEAMFSTGASGAELPLILETLDGKIIKTLKLDEEGELTFKIPKVPYRIFLDGGPGHTVREEGPRPQKS
ncbi:MAG: hypothetical protein MI749_06370 [Desulfovibrionales bacterium]|nr:hypothetical protein [Desulfovibrionales bacterium]